MTAVEGTATSTPLAQALVGHRIVDLSLTLDDRLPGVWPGHMPFEHKVHNWYAVSLGGGQRLRSTAPYYTCWMTLDEHAGTHFDAPAHFIPPPDSGLDHANEFGATYGDKVPLEQLQGPAAVVDVRSLRQHPVDGVSPLITPELLEAWQREHGPIGEGDVVVFFGGWDELYLPYPEGAKYVHRPVVTRDSPGWPAPSAEAVAYLYDLGVRTLGTDGPSIGAAHEGLSMHWAGLERGMAYVEGLAHLDELPARGSYFVFMPLKIAESSGGSGRALAYAPTATAP
jgi:kynurenine formamidase